MGNLEHEISHVPTGNRGKRSRLILPLAAALLTYAGCESLPKPTGFEQKPRAEYAAQGNQPIGSDLFPNADYGGNSGGPDPILPAFVDGLRAKYNTLPQAASVPFDTAYSEAAQKYQRAAKTVADATQSLNLEFKIVQDDRSAAKPSGEQAAYDLSWMPLLKGDWSQNRKIDYDDFFQFVDRFGLKRRDIGYDAAYDLDGNGTIDFDDFFQFVDRFGMFQSGVGVRASPTIEGKLQVAVPYVPGVRYLVGGKSVGAGSGDSLVVDVDVPQELYGQPVRLEAVGVNAQGDPIAGGLWRGDMPNYFANVLLANLRPNGDGRYTFNANFPANFDRVWVYVETEDRDDVEFGLATNKGTNGGDSGYLEEVVDRNGKSRLISFRTENIIYPGLTTFSFRQDAGKSYRVVLSDSENLKLPK